MDDRSRVAGEGQAFLDGTVNLPAYLHRYMGPVSASTILVDSTVSSVRISIRTFPGTLLRTAILMPVGVSETQNSNLAVAWLSQKLAGQALNNLGFCLKGIQALMTLSPPL